MPSVPIPIAQLRLDAENPRLAASLTSPNPSQPDLVEILWTEMDVEEVALSIAANGYYADEPLLVIPRANQTYIVIEGNRRLAAIMLLRDAQLRRRLRATKLPTISEGERRKLDELPVSIHPDRKSVWAYLGFRHVNGAKPWDGFSKAQYVADVHERYHVPLDEIARRIGDRHSTVSRLYHGFLVLRQAEEKRKFDRDDRVANRFYFSHLYTALDQPEFQKFLGLSADRYSRRDPVPSKQLDNLELLMTWLFGRKSEGIQPVVTTQFPDLNRLRNVVGKPQAVALLKAGRPLEVAFDSSIGDKARLRQSLTVAKDELQRARGAIPNGYAGEDDVRQLAEEIAVLAESIREEIERFGTARKKATIVKHAPKRSIDRAAR